MWNKFVINDIIVQMNGLDDVRVTVKRTHLHQLSHVVFLNLSVPVSVALSVR